MRGYRLTLLAIIVFASSLAFADVRDWDEGELGSVQSIKAALRSIKKSPNSDEKNQMIFFTEGILAYHQKKYEDSVKHLENALKGNNFLLDDYAHYFLGLAYSKQSNFKEAYKYFNKVSSAKPTSSRKFSAIFRMGEIAYKDGRYKSADQHLRLLERRIRGSEKYPDVLWNLVKTNIKRKNIHRACIYARKLYSRHPAHDLVSSWGMDLKKASFDGLQPGCIATLAQQKQRVRNLQYAGQSERAKSEIMSMYSKTNELTRYYVDVVYARFLSDEGDVEEALKVLLPHYEEHKNNVAYLMLLGKVGARKSDAPLAVSSYLKAHQLRPRSSLGREALFQAAFMSYLNQDYDGAEARFSAYKKQYRGTLASGSSWFIAWSKYLKGDYEGAYKMFDAFSKKRYSRKLRRYAFDKERIEYWKYVSLLKLGRLPEARAGLEKLAQNKAITYYSLVAKARLSTINSDLERQLASIQSQKDKLKQRSADLSPLALITPNFLPTPVAQTNSPESDAPMLETEDEILAEVTESGMTSDEGEDSAEEEVDPLVKAAPEDSSEEGDSIFASLKDPRLLASFQRAEALKALGFDDWANRELQYLEARTRNKSYLQTLMEKYEVSNTFSRSAYIAEIFFSDERLSGLSIDNIGWKKAFPLAYENEVSKIAKKLEIPPALVWAIMRAESFYKPKVKSSVGANGLMQVMPHTATKMAEMMKMKNFKVANLLEPETNISIGAKYIQRLSQKFNKHIPLVAAGYNAGPHRVHAWSANFGHLSLDEYIEHIPYSQTREYAKKVVRHFYLYENLYYPEEAQKRGLTWLAQPAPVALKSPIPTKESWDPL